MGLLGSSGSGGGGGSSASAAATTTEIVNAFSTTGFTCPATSSWALASERAARKTLSGALTANTLKTMLNLAGEGTLLFLGMTAVDATSRTMRMKITIDSVVVFDSTSAANTTAGAGFTAVGTVASPSTGSNAVLGEVPFRATCVVEIASSLTEIDKINFFDSYILHS